MSLKTILRRLSSPLLQVNGRGIDLAFDAEMSVDRGGEREYTQDRIGAGVDISGHSYVLPRRYEIEGAVSGLSQLHNFARCASLSTHARRQQRLPHRPHRREPRRRSQARC